MTVQSYLDDAVAAMTPSAEDRAVASAHRTAIQDAVVSGMDAFRIFETGSWSHGTALRVWSDVDYFASMRHVRPSQSYDDMLQLKNVLADKLRWSARSVTIDRPGVRIEWPSGPPTEVMPAHITGDHDYWIPDPKGTGWVKSSPLKHNEYVNGTRDLIPRTKDFVRLVKLWKYRSGAPITSLYLELRAAKYLREHQPFAMMLDLTGFFSWLNAIELAGLNDPSRFDGRRITAAGDSLLPLARLHSEWAASRADQARSAYLASDYLSAQLHLQQLISP
ncbi:hypothetical protein AAEP80_11155 [Curtobacterium sp. L3-7]|uniref:SMODS domain-containing nucleotidyltransferase n=1 Tax=Curtobacterium sp. L3-7 TaxID=3138787 RepID=UPI003B52B567